MVVSQGLYRYYPEAIIRPFILNPQVTSDVVLNPARFTSELLSTCLTQYDEDGSYKGTLTGTSPYGTLCPALTLSKCSGAEGRAAGLCIDAPAPQSSWKSLTQRVHVGISYLLGPEGGYHSMTLGPTYHYDGTCTLWVRL